MTLRRLRTLDPDALAAFIEAAERANERFASDAFGGAVDALRASVALLESIGHGGNECLERPLLKLLERMRGLDRERIRPGDVLPPEGGESGGVKRRSAEQGIRAAAAFAVESLHAHAGEPVQTAAGIVAERLRVADVKFAKAAKSDTAAVASWRRDYRRGQGGPAGERFRALRDTPPLQPSGDPYKFGMALLLWLDSELHRYGYSAPHVEVFPAGAEFLSAISDLPEPPQKPMSRQDSEAAMREAERSIREKLVAARNKSART